MNISILLRHSGIWVSGVNYECYKSDGIIVGQSISFLNLKAPISAELDIDAVRKNIEIRYIVEGFAMYPLCIDTTENIGGDIHNFNGTCREITCVEGSTQGIEALEVVESRIYDSYYIPELEVTNYITDSNSIEVKTGQLYKDKTTLVDVMAKYKIKHNFNCKVKRSDRQSLKTIDEGFDYCRPIVVVDGAHLGGAYKEIFLSASILGCILPLAYGVVDTETECS
ncbi:hypothetical protein H5410_045839 [Solanum commersonii]|uniref:Uncharacterized protein n=1 Tax=Solanum commersonii TaxID=4109 RepID=A0A9J5XCQ2_SOLCO|nr:hypothetical protein H5410_045839 [Solanum commersonii]